ncbi:MAG: hypothetical protein KDD47_20490 [Acidobacteria bacterium]|nr:hypothetical protein [Acidobacteriota bacterium]
MAEQSFATHRRFVPGYHYVLFLLLLATVIGSAVNLFVSIRRDQPLYDPALLLVLSICSVMIAFYARVFALKAQDRAIRAEENFRHYLLTGSPLDSRLRMRQIVGLRFASDEELPELAHRAAEEGLSEDDIKKAVKSWRADTYRA